MDEAVRMTTNTLLAIASMAMCGLAAAQALQDPMRPPASMIAPASGTAAAASSAAPQLQTILIGRAPGGRHLAVIDGETVRPGDDFRGARVARIADNEVELVRGRERQVLRLAATNAGGMSPVRAGARP
jgi:MSHA biogenesis protein MshK